MSDNEVTENLMERTRSRREVKPTWKFKEFCLNSKTDYKVSSNHTEKRKDHNKVNRQAKSRVSLDSKDNREKSTRKPLKDYCSVETKKTLLETKSSADKNEGTYSNNEERKPRNISGLNARKRTKMKETECNSFKESSSCDFTAQDKQIIELMSRTAEIKTTELSAHAGEEASETDKTVKFSSSVTEIDRKSGKQHSSSKLVLEDKSDSVEEKKYICDNNSRNKRGRKRKILSGDVSRVKKFKKLPHIPVKLEDHIESFCTEEFVSFDPVYKGKSRVDKLCQRFLCKLCNAYRTVSTEQLEKHISLHVNRQLNCQHCNYIANSLYNLSIHLRKEHREGNFVICELCGSEFCEKRAYKEHMTKVHKEAAYKCNLCNKKFLSRREYREHRLTDHEKAFKCDKCSEIFLFKRLLENHVAKNICVRKTYTCQHCGGEKKTQQILNEHIKRVHSKEHRFKCNLCTFSTGMNYILRHHMRAHLGIHPHKCEQCKFSCVKKWQLVSHMRTHTKEKSYKCDQCSYAAAWNVQLKSHMKAHDSPVQRICQICNVVFKDQRCFSTHYNKEHTGYRPPKTGKSKLEGHLSKYKSRKLVPVEGTNVVVYTMEDNDNKAEAIPNYVRNKTIVDILQSVSGASASDVAFVDLNETQHSQQNTKGHIGPHDQLCRNATPYGNDRAVSSGNSVNRVAEIKPPMHTTDTVDKTFNHIACNSSTEINILDKPNTQPSTANKTSTVSLELHDSDQSPSDRIHTEELSKKGDPIITNSQHEIPGRIETKHSFTQSVTNHLQENNNGTQCSQTKRNSNYKRSVAEDNPVSTNHGTVFNHHKSQTMESNVTPLSSGLICNDESSSVISQPLLESELLHRVAERSNNDVTYVQMRVNPDGTRRFKLVDQKAVLARQVSHSQNKTELSSISCTTSMSRSTAKDTHNYAAPAYKQRKRSSSSVAQYQKQAPEKELSAQNRIFKGTEGEYELNNTIPGPKCIVETTPEIVSNPETTTYIVNIDEPDSVEVATYQVITEGGEIAGDELQEIIIPAL